MAAEDCRQPSGGWLTKHEQQLGREQPDGKSPPRHATKTEACEVLGLASAQPNERRLLELDERVLDDPASHPAPLMARVHGDAVDLGDVLRPSADAHARDDLATLLDHSKRVDVRRDACGALLEERGVAAVLREESMDCRYVGGPCVANHHDLKMTRCAERSTRIKIGPVAKRRTTQPRKIPKQSRARATVAAIVEAAARILEEQGFDAMNVNRVAELAGVSIGSLYQYFPSKLALAGAVADELGREAAIRFGEGLDRVAELPLEAAIEAVVRRVFEIFRLRPRLRALIAKTLPEAVSHFDTPELDDRARALLVGYLTHVDGLRIPADRVEAAVDVLMASVQAVARENVEAEDDAKLEETIAMVKHYLVAPPER